MANFYRLIVACFLMISFGARADSIPSTLSYGAQWTSGGGYTETLDPLAACVALAGYRLAAGAGVISTDVSFAPPSSCAVDSGRLVFGGLGVHHVCPDYTQGPNASLMCTWTVPVCVAPQVLSPDTFRCMAPTTNNTNTCPKLGAAGGYYQGPGGTGDKTVCQADARVPSGDPAASGCQLVGYANIATGGNAPGLSVSAAGFSWGAQMEYSGSKCAVGSGDGGKPAPDDPQCTPPKVAGVANGKQVCYTPSPGSPEGSKTSTSSQPVKTVSTDNSDGSKSSTATGSKTDCADGKCTTTTTTTVTQTSPGGLIGAPQVNTTTSTCTQGPGCSSLAPNTKSTTTTSTSSSSSTAGTPTGAPTSTSTTSSTTGTSGGSDGKGGGGGKGNGDGDASQFAGQCGAVPFCDGDAILCAVAASTFATNCALTDPKAATPLYDAALQKTGDQTTALAGNSTVNVSSSQFDQTELLGAAVGMTDRSITVMNSTITLPFSNVNVWLARLGILLQAVTFLLCARVVVRG